MRSLEGGFDDTTCVALLKKISVDGRQKLKSAQKAWIDYRDAQCDFDSYGYQNGRIYPMILSHASNLSRNPRCFT